MLDGYIKASTEVIPYSGATMSGDFDVMMMTTHEVRLSICQEALNTVYLSNFTVLPAQYSVYRI